MAFFYGKAEGDIFSIEKKQWGWFQNGNQRGLILLAMIHALVMLIPVSAILVERHEELELFILNEEKAMIQPQRVVEKKNDPKVKEPPQMVVAPKEEVREIIENKDEIKKEEFKKIEEKPITEKTEPHIIEPAPPRVELPPVPISIPVAPSPKETELSKKPSPLLRSILHPKRRFVKL